MRVRARKCPNRAEGTASRAGGLPLAGLTRGASSEAREAGRSGELRESAACYGRPKPQGGEFYEFYESHKKRRIEGASGRRRRLRAREGRASGPTASPSMTT